jgi:hypothetical protein
MRFEGLFLISATLIPAGLSACGGSVLLEDAGGGGLDADGGGTSTGGPESSGGSSPTPGVLPEGFCQAACASTTEGSCFSTPVCSSYCEVNAPDWTVEIGAAFASCAAENPLCFETVEGCLLSELHPVGSLHTVRVDGSGFGAYDGKVLRVWHDPGAAPSFGGEVVIAGGTFSFEWEEAIHPFDTGGPLLLFYVDLDGDDACTASVDVTASEYPAWNGDLVDPVFELVLAAPLDDPDFVCKHEP